MRPLAAICLALFFQLSWPGAAPAQRVDRNKLRQSIQLPVISVNFQIGLKSLGCLSRRDHEKTRSLEELRTLLKASPSDHEAWLDLAGQLKKQANDGAREARLRAEQLLNGKIAIEPDNGYLCTQLAKIAADNDDVERAERSHRQAIEKSPNDWKCWHELTWFSFVRFLGCLTGEKEGLHTFETLEKAVQEKKPAASVVADAEQHLTNALACLDRAVTLAPREAQLFRERAFLRFASVLMYQPLLETLHKQQSPRWKANILTTWSKRAWGRLQGKTDPNDPLVAFNQVMGDLHTAIQLDPSDYSACSMEIMLGTHMFMAIHGIEETTQLERLPTDVRDKLRRLVEHLDELAEQKAADEARSACLEAAGVHAFLSDFAGTEKFCRRLLAKELDQEQALELLQGSLYKMKRYPELVESCRESCRRQPTPRNHLKLAKSLAYAGDWNQVEAVLQFALAKSPEEPTLNLGMAAVLMRKEDEFLSSVTPLLQRAQAAINERSPKELKDDLTVTHAVYRALAGQPAEARQALQRLRESSPDHDGLKGALTAFSR